MADEQANGGASAATGDAATVEAALADPATRERIRLLLSELGSAPATRGGAIPDDVATDAEVKTADDRVAELESAVEKILLHVRGR